MDELELIVAILVGLFKLVRFFLRILFRPIFALGRMVRRAQDSGSSAPRPVARRLGPPSTRPVPRARATSPLAPAWPPLPPAPAARETAHKVERSRPGPRSPEPTAPRSQVPFQELMRDAILLDAILERPRILGRR